MLDIMAVLMIVSLQWFLRLVFFVLLGCKPFSVLCGRWLVGGRKGQRSQGEGIGSSAAESRTVVCAGDRVFYRWGEPPDDCSRREKVCMSINYLSTYRDPSLATVARRGCWESAWFRSTVSCTLGV